jgi:hypothetical protein
MKKSSMIEEIARVIRDTMSLSEKDMATAVLAKVEELGMQPPVEEVCPVLFTTKRIWEREND